MNDLIVAEPRPGFTKATVSAWRVSLEARGLGSSSIIIRMSAIRKLAVEASDNGLLAPELAAGIARVKSAKSIGIRVGDWLTLRQVGNPGQDERDSGMIPNGIPGLSRTGFR